MAETVAFLRDPDLTLYCGDAREVLATLPERSVHAALCSPPFYGLRNYQTGEWRGGIADHEHDLVGARGGRGGSGTLDKRSGSAMPSSVPANVCVCGAEYIDAQIGLEDSPEEWAEALVAVFREVRRVLRDDASLWVECGDSYALNGPGSPNGGSLDRGGKQHRANRDVAKKRGDDLKPKDLIGQPFLLAFALRVDGWYWRGMYIWEKPDAMPESATDRCTTAHSYVMHFSKSARYFHDGDAIREPFSENTNGGRQTGAGARYVENGVKAYNSERVARFQGPSGVVTASAQLDLDGQDAEPERRGADSRRVTTVVATHNSEQHRDGERWPSPQGRNARSVWRITTEATSFGLCPVCRTYWDSGAPAEHCGVRTVAHFATWPHALAGKIIACATSEAGCCEACGAPRVRVAKRETMVIARSERQHGMGQTRSSGTVVRPASYATLGFAPSCACDAPTVPCTVLDPLAGSATTGRQARMMGRHAVLIELSPDYAEIAVNRLQQLSLLA